MIRKLLTMAALWAASTLAFATTIPGESAYCIAHCLTGYCQPVIATLGEKNVSIGLPLGVVFTTMGGGTEIKPATAYTWAWVSGSHGTPTNLTGISTDGANAYVIPKVTMNDSGLYLEEGSAVPGPFDTGGGIATLNWCVTVNPIAVLNNNLTK